MLWLRGRDPGPRVHHRATGLFAAVDLEDGAAHISIHLARPVGVLLRARSRP